jgi:hypothetical protein
VNELSPTNTSEDKEISNLLNSLTFKPSSHQTLGPAKVNSIEVILSSIEGAERKSRSYASPIVLCHVMRFLRELLSDDELLHNFNPTTPILQPQASANVPQPAYRSPKSSPVTISQNGFQARSSFPTNAHQESGPLQAASPPIPSQPMSPYSPLATQSKASPYLAAQNSVSPLFPHTSSQRRPNLASSDTHGQGGYGVLSPFRTQENPQFAQQLALNYAYNSVHTSCVPMLQMHILKVILRDHEAISSWIIYVLRVSLHIDSHIMSTGN